MFHAQDTLKILFTFKIKLTSTPSGEIKTQDWKLGRLETVSRVLDLFVNRECHMSDYVGYNIPLLTTLCSFFLFFSIGPALAALYQRLTCGWWP